MEAGDAGSAKAGGVPLNSTPGDAADNLKWWLQKGVPKQPDKTSQQGESSRREARLFSFSVGASVKGGGVTRGLELQI